MEVEQVRELQSTDNVLVRGDPEPLDKFGLAFPSAFCPVLWNEADAHLYDCRENLTSWNHMYTSKLFPYRAAQVSTGEIGEERAVQRFSRPGRTRLSTDQFRCPVQHPPSRGARSLSII
jgi:hypothetical protein